MNPYFFFGFHILKDINVTFMRHLYLRSGLDGIIELLLEFQLEISN